MDTKNVDKSSLEFEGIDFSDSPDFCDAYISKAYWNSGEELTEKELDDLNNDSQYVYENLMDWIY